MAKKISSYGCSFFCSLIVCALISLGANASAQPKTRLESKTLEAYEKFVLDFEKDIDAMVLGNKPFLWIHDQDSQAQNRAHRGEALIFKSHENIDAPKGIIHIWGVSVFLADVKAEEVIELLLDYDRHKDIYPSVIDSKLLEKNGDTVTGYLKFKYKKVLTAVLNTTHQAELVRLNKGRYFIRVHSMRIAEVENDGEPDERELPVGKDSGFMWRLNTYWFVDPQPDGVFIECQSLTLSRSLPFVLGWLVKPFVNSIPRDSLQELVEGTRKALQ